jgi:DNA-directed RNA polymerase specialized sigma24 family protein
MRPAPTADEFLDAARNLREAFDGAVAGAETIRQRVDWLEEQRHSGATTAGLVRGGERLVLLEATNATLEALLTAGTRLRRIATQLMYADGLTMDEIARAMGVTRQRVSKLLRSDPDAPGPPWTRH